MLGPLLEALLDRAPTNGAPLPWDMLRSAIAFTLLVLRGGESESKHQDCGRGVDYKASHILILDSLLTPTQLGCC